MQPAIGVFYWRIRQWLYHFIEALQPQADMIMSGQSWRKPFRSRAELETWCKDNQPYYKQTILEVISFFAERYGLN